MLRSALAALAIATLSTGAFAQSAPTITTPAMPWSEAYTLTPFETMPASVATATDKATGKSFNVVKLPNGKMMVLISANKLVALSPFSDDSEMMFSGHGGTTR